MNEIELYLAPQRVEEADWASVYAETLRLAQAAHFLDIGYAEEEGQEYSYACPVAHKPNCHGEWEAFAGWESYGDRQCLADPAQTFGVSDTLAAYLPQGPAPDDGADILTVLPWKEEFAGEKAARPGGLYAVDIWAGRAAVCQASIHIPLLAIACLVCDRLPQAAILGGDISAGQCRRAVRWANSVLETPISVPATADAVRLVGRVQASQMPDTDKFIAVMSVYNGVCDVQMGDVLQKAFPVAAREYYHKKRFMSHPQASDAFEDILHEYLEMGFGLAELCRILVTDADGYRMEPRQFLSLLLRTRLHVQDKETYDVTRPAVEQRWRGDVDGPDLEAARWLGRLLGLRNHNVDAYLPLPELRDVCRKALGEAVDVDAEVDRLLAEQADAPDPAQLFWERMGGQAGDEDGLQAEIEARQQDRGRYDIYECPELAGYRAGMRVYPPLWEKAVAFTKQIKAWQTELLPSFWEHTRLGKVGYFIRRSMHLPLFPKATWDYLFAHLEDAAVMARYVCLMSIQVGSGPQDGYLRAMLWQPELFARLWKEAE